MGLYHVVVNVVVNACVEGLALRKMVMELMSVY